MNFLGKILVVVIFIMTIFFMAAAMMVYAMHRNWRQLGQDYQTKLTEVRAETTRLQNEHTSISNTLIAERAAKAQALAKGETENELLAGENALLAAENDKLKSGLAVAVEELKVKQDNLASLTKEVDGLRGEIRKAQQDTDEQFAKATALADQLHQKIGQLTVQQERAEQLALQVQKAKRLLSEHGASIDDEPGVPTVDGYVHAIGQNDQIEISLGSDDGIKAGDTLDVYRNSKYLGRIRVVATEPDKAVAAILKDFQKGVIQRGDRVATRIKA